MRSFLLSILLFIGVGCGASQRMEEDHKFTTQDIRMIERCIEALREHGSSLIDAASGRIDREYQKVKVVRVSAIDSVLMIFGKSDAEKVNKSWISDKRGITCRMNENLEIVSLVAPRSVDSRDVITLIEGDVSAEDKEYDHIMDEIKKGEDVILKQRLYELTGREWMPASQYIAQKMDIPESIQN